MTEYQIHAAIYEYLCTVLPNALIWHTTNNPRNKVAGARLKRLGMRAGVPDLCVVTNEKLYLFEVKVPGKYAKPEQREFMADALSQGVLSAVVRSVDDVQRALESWCVKTRQAA